MKGKRSDESGPSVDATYDDDYVEFYDIINSSEGKDYAAEAADVAELIRSRNPNAASLLDVACGTGEHLRHFRRMFDRVAGVDLSEPMCSVAARKMPDVPIHTGDMRTFELSGTFDAVVCLFWTIGYMRDLDELSAAVKRMVAHLAPGGVLLVEPWAAPDEYEGGGIAHMVVERNGRTLIQMIYARPLDGRLSISDMYNLVGDGSGIRRWTEVHALGLFTTEEYLDAFARAELDRVEAVSWRGKRARIVGIRPH